MRLGTALPRLIAAATAALTVHLPAFAADSPPSLHIVHAATARIVFREGKHIARFTDAELAYGDLKLFAEQIEHDSSQRTVDLTGGVLVQSPEYSLNAQKCSMNLATGHITADGAIELVNVPEGVTIRGEHGSVRVEPATHRVLKVELAGNISAEWDKGVMLQGSMLESDFNLRIHKMAGDFTAVVDTRLLPPPLSGLSGGGLTLTGNSLILQAEEGAPQMLSLSATAVEVNGDKLGLYGPEFKARLALAADREVTAKDGMLQLSGSEGDPASGWILDEEGRQTSFSALHVEKAMGTAELILKSSVLVASPDFSLHADSVSIAQKGQSFSVSIPERFRIAISPEVFRNRSQEAGSSDGS
jgi:hypothetical protein